MSSFLGLTALQLAHAKRVVAATKSYVIDQVGKPVDVAERAADIALETALVESSLMVYANPKVPGSLQLPHDAVGHDHLSVGLFQQQVPLWGNVLACQTIEASTLLFLRRLLALDWAGRSNGELAQRVQGSAYPARYAMRDRQAINIRKAVW